MNQSTLKLALIQTWAIFVDAYRELNAKRLFWVTMILSCLVVGAFGAVGFDDTGFSIFGKQFKHPFLNTVFLPIAQLYKNLFIELGVNWWLGFFALILALVSTAPMIPDFLGNGAVDLYLARPLGRMRLFVTKYVAGLLFVSAQVIVFCLASMLVIGIRGGAWVPGLFLAVPVVVLMFSYLWSICALVGTITRSTIAALLLTMLAWFAIFGVHAAESILLRFSTGARVETEFLDKDIDRLGSDIETLNAKYPSTQPMPIDAARLRKLQTSLDIARSQRERASDPFASWHTALYIVKWPLPKTTETTELLGRWLDRQFRAPRERERDVPSDPDEQTSRNFFRDPRVRRETFIRVDQILRERSATWVIGTSLLFEAAMVGLAGWVFCRRDY
ncbi:MAG: ABC transporter permease subunit [Tepidisphaeraceae bacterium]